MCAVPCMRWRIGVWQDLVAEGYLTMGIGTPPMDGQTRGRPLFFSVEAKPQAIESLFCEALNVAFVPSVDNLVHASSAAVLAAFENRIELWRARLLGGGLPRRASRFLTALECYDGRGIRG